MYNFEQTPASASTMAEYWHLYPFLPSGLNINYPANKLHAWQKLDLCTGLVISHSPLELHLAKVPVSVVLKGLGPTSLTNLKNPGCVFH